MTDDELTSNDDGPDIDPLELFNQWAEEDLAAAAGHSDDGVPDGIADDNVVSAIPDDLRIARGDDVYVWNSGKNKLCEVKILANQGIKTTYFTNYIPQVMSVQETRDKKGERRYIVRVLCMLWDGSSVVVILRGPKVLSSDRYFAEALRAQLDPDLYEHYDKGCNDMLLRAAQQFRRNVEHLKVVSESGWWSDSNGEWFFATPGAIGAIGAGLGDTPCVNTDLKMSEELLPEGGSWPTNFANYGIGMGLPLPGEEHAQALEAFKHATALSRQPEAGLIVLHAFASTLRSMGMPMRFILHLQSATGGLKTTGATLMASFVRPFNRDDEKHVGSWGSTGGSLMLVAHNTRDLPLVIDDFKGGAHMAAAREVVQAFGDGAARGRLNADATAKKSHNPLGGIISTGQDGIDEGEDSNAARVLTLREVSFCEEVDLQQKQIDLDRFDDFELRRQEAYRWFGTLWLRWCARLANTGGGDPDRPVNGLATTVTEVLRDARAALKTERVHLRLREAPAPFMATGELLARFVASEWPEAEQWVRDWVAAMETELDKVVSAQQEQVNKVSPANTFVDEVSSANRSGDDYLSHRLNVGQRLPLTGGNAPGARSIGFFDDGEFVYFQEQTVMAWLRRRNPKGEVRFSWNQLREDIVRRGYGGYFGRKRTHPAPTDRLAIAVRLSGTKMSAITSGIYIRAELIFSPTSLHMSDSDDANDIDDDPFIDALS